MTYPSGEGSGRMRGYRCSMRLPLLRRVGGEGACSKGVPKASSSRAALACSPAAAWAPRPAEHACGHCS